MDYCEWHGCTVEATRVIYGVKIKRGAGEAFVGDVELCYGHFRRAERLGRVTLDPDRIVWSLEELDEENYGNAQDR